MNRLKIPLAAVLVCLLALSPAAGSDELGAPLSIGDFQLSYGSKPLRVEIRSASTGEILLGTKPGMSFLRFERAETKVKSTFGSYDFKEDRDAAASAWSVSEVEQPEGSLVLLATLRAVPPSVGLPPGTARIEFTSPGEGTLHVKATLQGGSFNRVLFTHLAVEGEDYLGFGEQYNRIKHAGREVPIWVSEQGIGRVDWPVRLPFNGTTDDSYFPIPYFLSTAGYGYLADTTARSVFHLNRPRQRDRFSVDIWDREGGFYLFRGPKPADVIRQLTAVTGRPRMLPDWGFGVWAAIQGGPDRIREFVTTLKDGGVPLDAVWAQDWLGARKRLFGYDVRYHWTVDEGLYPDLAGFIDELHGQGVRFMGYFNSFIEQEFPEFAEAQSRGFLVRKPGAVSDKAYMLSREAEGPYVQLISIFRGGLVDMSNPEARHYLAGFLRKALQAGMDGWMADFGEWLPWDGVIHSERGAPLEHNRYPIEWARLNRETCLEERPDGDFVIFSRSGYAGSTPWVDMVWAGDQNTNWSKDDGLPTVVPAGLNLGLSGVPFYHFDAGGFTSLVSLPRRSQLFRRWVEAAAMSPLMRTHEGYWRQLNVQVDSNESVLAHFAAMARLHKWIQPKLIEAAREATETGLPIMRHLWLAYPEDRDALDVEDQYLLGGDLLAAPVLKPNREHLDVYFPAGSSWRHWKTGQVYSGPGRHRVAVPLGTPALFVRQGVEMPPAP